MRQWRGLQSRRRRGRTDPARGLAHAGAARRGAERCRKRGPAVARRRRWCASRSPIAISPRKISNCGARCSSIAWRRRKPVPEWAVERADGRCSVTSTARWRRCFRNAHPNELGITARSLFSAVHGMVALGLEQKLIAVPIEALRQRDRDHRARDGRWAHGEARLGRGTSASHSLKFSPARADAIVLDLDRITAFWRLRVIIFTILDCTLC